jgi:tRNA threonylcarbamoyladenosine biosynthesis protein TsaE
MIRETEAGEQELGEIVRQLLPYLQERRVILLKGEPGSGKTTLVKALMRGAGYSGIVQSPTYALVNHYETEDGLVVYHFDLYRLENRGQADEAGISELLTEEVCRLVEWPERLESSYFSDPVMVEIENRPSKRHYRIEDKKRV